MEGVGGLRLGGSPWPRWKSGTHITMEEGPVGPGEGSAPRRHRAGLLLPFSPWPTSHMCFGPLLPFPTHLNSSLGLHWDSSFQETFLILFVTAQTPRGSLLGALGGQGEPWHLPSVLQSGHGIPELAEVTGQGRHPVPRAPRCHFI